MSSHPEITREILDYYKKAGKVAKETLDFAKKLIKPGENMFNVAKQLDSFIVEKGYVPAFPSQISINEIAAHYCPYYNEPTTFQEGQIIKVDVGVLNKGFIADTATTIILNLDESKILKEASKAALNNAINSLEVGIELKEISKVIESTINKFENVNVVRNLSGHSLKPWNLHSDPNVFNIYIETQQDVIKPNMVLAIEPFTTFGQGYVVAKGKATIFSLKNKVVTRNPFAREILNFLSSRKRMPFALWWLEERFGKVKAEAGLRDLLLKKAVEQYPPLVEQSNGLVAQEEHTVVIDADGKKHVVTSDTE